MTDIVEYCTEEKTLRGQNQKEHAAGCQRVVLEALLNKWSLQTPEN